MRQKRHVEAVPEFRTAIAVRPLADEKGITTFMPGAEAFPYLNLFMALKHLKRVNEAKVGALFVAHSSTPCSCGGSFQFPPQATLEAARAKWPKDPNVLKAMADPGR
jgi:hypothetical protein